MNKKVIIKKTRAYVKKALEREGTGHDWWHVERVTRLALRIARRERARPFIVELAALLHDIADWKFHGGDDSAGPQKAREWLRELGVGRDVIRHVCEIIRSVSFKGAGTRSVPGTVEAAVVQDADRLDAIGAIGIARTFAYGGFKGFEIHNPGVKPVMHKSFAEYKKSRGPVINHFHEKLLLLKDRMNTETAKRMARKRHSYMEAYLKRFLLEWEGRA
jgi:uncharacterized protein